MNLLVKNIKQLVQAETTPVSAVAGKAMGSLPCVEQAWLHVRDGRIKDFGAMPVPDEVLKQMPPDTEIIEADGRLVMPCWADAHTHMVFARSREDEFVDRVRGLSYEEIARRGGGILNSAKRLRETDEDELYESASARVREVMATGTGSLEIKSGYGLSFESELKMLRVARRLRENHDMIIRTTFLGAHAIPAEFRENRRAYIDLVIGEMLPRVAEEKLADFADVFCERGYFSRGETEEILAAAAALGLKPKVHANQLSNSGGVQAGVTVGAWSVEHLEYIGKEEIDCLKDSGTMPVLLPGAAFFLDMPCAPARSLIDAGLPVGMASDYNPGSCPSGNMNFMVALLCIQYKMTPEEAINAATINGARAMDAASETGSIARGKRADFFISRPIPSYNYIPYAYTSNPVERVFIGGREQQISK